MERGASASKIRFAEFGFGIYNGCRVSDPRGLRESYSERFNGGEDEGCAV